MRATRHPSLGGYTESCCIPPRLWAGFLRPLSGLLYLHAVQVTSFSPVSTPHLLFIRDAECTGLSSFLVLAWVRLIWVGNHILNTSLLHKTLHSMRPGTIWSLLTIVFPTLDTAPSTKTNRPLGGAPLPLEFGPKVFPNSSSYSSLQIRKPVEAQRPTQSHSMNLWQSLLTHSKLS